MATVQLSELGLQGADEITPRADYSYPPWSCPEGRSRMSLRGIPTHAIASLETRIASGGVLSAALSVPERLAPLPTSSGPISASASRISSKASKNDNVDSAP